jgi:Glycosyltransferase family 87
VRNRSTRIVALAAVAALSIAAVAASLRMTHGFSSYYTAAHALVAGEFGPWVYSDAAFGQYLRTVVGTDVREIYAPNTPAAALLAVPVVYLPPLVARSVWLGLTVAALVLAVFWLATEAAQRNTPLLALWIAAALINAAVLANIRTAQAYVLLFAAMVAALRMLARDRDALAGVVLGLVFATKPTIAPLLLLLVWIRRYRAVRWWVGTSVGIVLLTMPAVSLETWLAWPDAARAFIARPATSIAAYQTTIGLLRHVCVADANEPDPIAHCGAAAAIVPPLATLAAVAITLWKVPRTAVRFAIAAGICLSLLATPIAEDHQFVVLAIPMFILATDAPELGGWLVATVLLLWLPESWTWERFTAGWWALLGYPRLFATWMLWALTITAAPNSRQRQIPAVTIARHETLDGLEAG